MTCGMCLVTASESLPSQTDTCAHRETSGHCLNGGDTFCPKGGCSAAQAGAEASCVAISRPAKTLNHIDACSSHDHTHDGHEPPHGLLPTAVGHLVLVQLHIEEARQNEHDGSA